MVSSLRKGAIMKLTISHNKKVLKTIELTSLQLKAFQLLGLKPEDYLEREHSL